ncbi:MAG: NADP-dependent oxidoreductase [Chloroflexota bacterium]
MNTSREIHLKSRPVGMPIADNFELVTVPRPEAGEGEILIRNHYMSVDPYMRGRMVDRKSYTPPFQLGAVMDGGCVGEVVESNNPAFAVGSFVLGQTGWREHFVSNGKGLMPIDPNVAPIQSYLGAMGMPGWTAYFGLLDIGNPQAGETVFVSAAAGAVGSVVCQIAKIKGCRVVGSVGSQTKADWLVNELGIDAAFNYKEADNLTAVLRQHCPDGIDVYFENVGGAHLEAALNVMNVNGRMPVCGMISQYNNTRMEPGPGNLTNIIGKRLLLKGFIVTDYMRQLPQFFADMGPWAASGQMKWRETIVEGLENAPEAFIGLFTGENLGKMLVKLV